MIARISLIPGKTCGHRPCLQMLLDFLSNGEGEDVHEKVCFRYCALYSSVVRLLGKNRDGRRQGFQTIEARVRYEQLCRLLDDGQTRRREGGRGIGWCFC